MKRRGLAYGIAFSLAGLGTAVARDAPADPPDPASSAIEIAMMIGQIQALASICAPPESSYEQALDKATDALQTLYRKAGLDPDEIAADIDEGRQDETQRHDDISYPLNCDLFARQVSAVEDHVIKARKLEDAAGNSDENP